MDKWLKYLFIVVFLLLAGIQFSLFYNTYNLKQEELHGQIIKSIQTIKSKIEQHETLRHKILFEQYKNENLCGDTYASKNLELTFNIAPTDTFSNLKDLTDIITKKLANQAMQSGRFMLKSLPLDTSYIYQISKQTLNDLDKNIGIDLLLTSDTNQVTFEHNFQTILFDDYRLYHPTFLLFNIGGLSKMLAYQIVLMLLICIVTMAMLFIVTRYAYLSIIKFKKLSDEKADFINHLAHEIKTPLSSIHVSSQALIDKRIINNQENVTYYSEIIFLEAEKLHRQLENVLSISAAESNFLNLQLNELNLHELIVQVSALFQKRISVQNGQMAINLAATNPLVNADKIHLGNVLYNILDNALKYSKANHILIHISTCDIANGIEVNIQDHGKGIGENELKKIFNLFYKSDSKEKGFGVGLHYAKKIMQHHKGEISVKSKLGEGTIFSLFIPRTPHE